MQRQTPSREVLVNPVIHPRHGSNMNSVADARLTVASVVLSIQSVYRPNLLQRLYAGFWLRTHLHLRSWNLAPNQRALPFGLAGSGRARVQKGFEVHEYHPVETFFQEV
jgi:hypothetical protein